MKDADAAYQTAVADFRHGYLKASLVDIGQAQRLYCGADSDTCWRFRLLNAEIFMWQGFNHDALTLLQESPAPTSPSLAARRSVLLGNVESSLQELDKAAATFQSTEKMPGVKSPEVYVDLLLAEGKLAALQRNAAKSKSLFEQALQLAQTNSEPFLESKALGNLGILEMRNYRFADAVDDFNAAVSAAKASDAQAAMVKLTVNLGWAYRSMGDFDRAYELFSESEQQSRQLGMLADQETSLMNIAIIESEEHHSSDAEKGYQQALALARTLKNQQEIAYSFVDLAQAAIEQGNYRLAEIYNQQALAPMRSLHDRDTELYTLINSAQIAQSKNEWRRAKRLLQEVIQDSAEDLYLRGLAYWYLAKIDAQQNRVPDAEKEYEASIASLEAIRKSLGREEFTLSYPARSKDIYSDYIDFLVSQRMQYVGLRVAELQRSRTLMDGLVLRERHLPTSDTFAIESTAAKVGHPILFYWVGRKASYLWVVLPTHTQFFTLPAESTIRPVVERYRAHLLGPLGDDSLHSADGHQLYKILIGPAEAWIRPQSEVTIIADGPLCGLNFETLPVALPRPHYWIEDVSITNASSAFLLTHASRSKPARRTQPEKHLLLIGNPQSPPNYPPLSHAAEEMHMVGEHFLQGKETILSGKDATPAAYFKAKPGEYSLIHFVAHGTASRLSPLDSAVVLSQDGSSYNLYARDVAAKPLHAELVTISACDSAGTRIYSSEGLVGLSWAFLRAGARRVIASLWEANDASTPKLMDQLYSEMAEGKDPAGALRDAKLTLLHSNGIYSRPFYWAPFVLYQGI